MVILETEEPEDAGTVHLGLQGQDFPGLAANESLLSVGSRVESPMWLRRGLLEPLGIYEILYSLQAGAPGPVPGAGGRAAIFGKAGASKREAARLGE